MITETTGCAGSATGCSSDRAFFVAAEPASTEPVAPLPISFSVTAGVVSFSGLDKLTHLLRFFPGIRGLPPDYQRIAFDPEPEEADGAFQNCAEIIPAAHFDQAPEDEPGPRVKLPEGQRTQLVDLLTGHRVRHESAAFKSIFIGVGGHGAVFFNIVI